MAVLHLQRLVRMSVPVLAVIRRVEIGRSTYRRLFFGVFAPCGLCAEVCPHATVSSAIDSATAGCLRIEYWQFGDPSLDTGDGGLLFALWVPPHQPLPIVPIVVIVIRV